MLTLSLVAYCIVSMCCTIGAFVKETMNTFGCHGSRGVTAPPLAHTTIRTRVVQQEYTQLNSQEGPDLRRVVPGGIF